MELNKIASVSDEAKGSASPSPNNNSSGTRSKLKTKAANSYGQFLKHRRLELKQADPHAKLNRSEVSKEWRSMGSEAKKVFVERYRKEKELIGPIDRKASKVKVDALKKVKQIKNPKGTFNITEDNRYFVWSEDNQYCVWSEDNQYCVRSEDNR